MATPFYLSGITGLCVDFTLWFTKISCVAGAELRDGGTCIKNIK